MSPNPYHQPHQPDQHNHSILNAFNAALSDLSTLKPTLLTLRHDYLALDLQLRNLTAENLQATSQIEDLTKKNERLEKERTQIERDCVGLFAEQLKAQNHHFTNELGGRDSGSKFVDSPMWLRNAVTADGGAAGGNAVVEGPWKREWMLLWVHREDGGLGRIDGVGGITRERVVGGWENWKKGLEKRVTAKREGLKARLVEKRARLVEKKAGWGERWREEKARIRGEDDLDGWM